MSSQNGSSRAGTPRALGSIKLELLDGSVVDATLYCHQETINIAGTSYYLLKLDTPADASGTTLSVPTGSVGRAIWGRFVLPLINVRRILSATINAVYRAYTGGGTVNAEIDILIRKSDGTIRTTIATGVSKSANLGSSWATYIGASYSFPGYETQDITDYFEIDYIANVTVRKAGQFAYLRIDDQSLSPSDQTRSYGWEFVIEEFTRVYSTLSVQGTEEAPVINPPPMIYSTISIQGSEEAPVINPPPMIYSTISIQGSEEAPVINPPPMIYSTLSVQGRAVETIITKTYPMYYKLEPVKSGDLVSRIRDVDVQRTASDYPTILIRKGRASELRSKF